MQSVVLIRSTVIMFYCSQIPPTDVPFSLY